MGRDKVLSPPFPQFLNQCRTRLTSRELAESPTFRTREGSQAPGRPRWPVRSPFCVPQTLTGTLFHVSLCRLGTPPQPCPWLSHLSGVPRPGSGPGEEEEELGKCLWC